MELFKGSKGVARGLVVYQGANSGSWAEAGSQSAKGTGVWSKSWTIHSVLNAEHLNRIAQAKYFVHCDTRAV